MRTAILPVVALVVSGNAAAMAGQARVAEGFAPGSLAQVVVGCGAAEGEACGAALHDLNAAARRLGLAHRVAPYLAGGLPWSASATSADIAQPWHASWSVEIGPMSVPSLAPIADWRDDIAKRPSPPLRPASGEAPSRSGFTAPPGWHYDGRRRR